MNETPENQSTPPAAGGHDLGPQLSSEPAAPAAPDAAEPGAAPAHPDAAPAHPGAAPAHPGVTPDYPGTPAYPGAAPAYPGQAPAYPGQAPAYPGQAPGYPGQAPAYDPNAAQGAPAGHYDPNAFAYGTAPIPPAPKKPMSKGLLWGLIGGGVVLILLIAAAIIVPQLIKAGQPTAADAAEGYLQALADGDAETAVSFLDGYQNQDLLTDEVLQKSLELAPIDDIVVGESEDADEYAATVPVTFTIGGEEVSRTFDLYRSDDEWTIGDGTVPVSTLTQFEDLGLTINGAAVPEGGYVFPGTYELALGMDAFVLTGESNVFTLAEYDDGEVLYDVRTEVSESGVETFRSLVKASLEECLAMKTLNTPCGMDITDIDLSGATPIEGTVTRTLTKAGTNDLAALTVESAYEGAIVTTHDSVDVDMTLEGEKDGQRFTYEVWFGGYLDSPRVDFAAETPTVVWE